MKVQYEDLTSLNLEFKNIISGPAPVGRILNYVILAGKGKLKHKNGNRDLSLTNDIAYAWTSELMVGLGLARYPSGQGDAVVPFYLTNEGKDLFEVIKDFKGKFDESPNVTNSRKQLKNYSTVAFAKFENIFKGSVLCKNLCKYMINKNTNVFSKSTFYDEYFGTFKEYYTGEKYIYNPLSTAATTGGNRVPSLTQLCDFFGCLTIENGNFIFDFESLNSYENGPKYIPLDSNLQQKLTKEEQRNEIIVEDLIKKYGIDGTVAREIVTRNSSVQDIFRNNLIARYGCHCAVCSKDIEEVMIASHIQPASESNVIEKANCENGLLLCALHDKLFDRYLISFDFVSGKLLYAKELEGKLADYQLTEDFVLDEKYMTEERKQFLMKHNLAFYERNK